MEKSFTIKFRGVIGPEDKDDKVMRILNRVITWTEEGLVYEPDQRHAELIVNQLELDNCKTYYI